MHPSNRLLRIKASNEGLLRTSKSLNQANPPARPRCYSGSIPAAAWGAPLTPRQVSAPPRLRGAQRRGAARRCSRGGASAAPIDPPKLCAASLLSPASTSKTPLPDCRQGQSQAVQRGEGGGFASPDPYEFP